MAPWIKEKRGIFSGLAVVTLMTVLAVVAFALFLQQRCVSNFRDALVVYPGAELIEEESVFLGAQRVVYHSADAPEEIEQSITTQYAARMRDAVVSGDFSNTERQNWLIEPDAERGGSLLTMQTTCP